MRINILLLCFVTFLTGCTLPGTQKEENIEITSLFKAPSYEMQVPKTWTSASGSALLTPKIGSIELALISPDVKYGFSNTLVVVRDTLNGVISSARYSQLNNVQTSRNYLEYEKVQDEPIIFGDSDSSRVYVFKARYNQTTPQLQFIQTAKVCGTTVYLIHFALALDKDASPYIALAKTFACK